MLKHARSATRISKDCNKFPIGETCFRGVGPRRFSIQVGLFSVQAQNRNQGSSCQGDFPQVIVARRQINWISFLSLASSLISASFYTCFFCWVRGPPLVFLSYVSLRGFRCSSFTGVTPKASRYLWHEGCMQSVCFDVISICLFISLGSFTTFYLQSIMFQDL